MIHGGILRTVDPLALGGVLPSYTRGRYDRFRIGGPTMYTVSIGNVQHWGARSARGLPSAVRKPSMSVWMDNKVGQSIRLAIRTKALISR